MRAFVRYDNQGIIVPTSFVMKKTMPKVGQWKEISTSKSVSGFPAQSSQKNLRAFVRYNGKNKVVPGSVVVRGQVPSGNWSEITYDLSRPISAGYVFLNREELRIATILWEDDRAQAMSTYGEINTWNVSAVTNMNSTFSSLSTFNSDISNWDVSNVTNGMYNMFQGTSFNQDISGWNVSNVTTMKGMFSNSPFNQDISSWNVGNVTDMSRMFGSTIFNQPIGDWDVSSVVNMGYMFQNSIFNQPINSWDVNDVLDMEGIFSSNSFFDQPLNNWDVSTATDMKFMFSNATSFNQDISSWNVSNVTDMRRMFYNAVVMNQDLSIWDVNGVQDYEEFDTNTPSWVLPKPAFGQGYVFADRTELKTAVDLWVSNEPQAIIEYGEINTWNVSNVTDMSSLFLNKTTFNSDISNWNMSNVTDMSYMFNFCTSFNQPIENWNVSSVSNMEAMFSIQSNLSPGSFNQPLDNWNTSNLTNTNSMFVNQGSFQGLGLQNWDMSNVTSSPEMFRQCSSLTNVALENWDVSNIFDMRGMFKDCINYNRDLSSWSVNNATLCLNFSDGATSWTLPKPNFTNCTPSDIEIVDRPTDSTTSLISTFSNDTPVTTGNFIVLADFFQVTEEVTLDTFIATGINSGNDPNFDGTGVSIFIYTDAGGIPSSNPTVPSGSILSLENIPLGSGLSWQNATVPSTPNGIEFTVDITQANIGVPVTLPIGNYWLCFGQNTNGIPTGSGRWNWTGSFDTTLYQTMLIDPQNLFGAGATNWTTVTSLIGSNFPTSAWTLTKL